MNSLQEVWGLFLDSSAEVISALGLFSARGRQARRKMKFKLEGMAKKFEAHSFAAKCAAWRLKSKKCCRHGILFHTWPAAGCDCMNPRCRSVPQRYFCTFGCLAIPSAHLRLVALHKHSSCTCKSCLVFLFHYIRLLTTDIWRLASLLSPQHLLTCCLLYTISTAAAIAPQLSVMRIGLLCSNQMRWPRGHEDVKLLKLIM